ncbi:hypothetical protein GCM10010082_27410 [Kushneria pakistanensis]|uniref:Gluconate 2-dehydrogenase n=1 Tax=Kushneria pakistanensis TaxID=1508770 RepID=A0ABQ3FP26_9GAMM|nr:gluconate 2-dehydrogenase subunit 3 family protein [Kushneria pakistanensis]GHC31683.1 hypothetical protein GCM10010082_27410 [Kushneria pakistanensis]
MSSRIQNRQRRDFIRGSLTMIPAITLGSGVTLTAQAAEQAPALSDYSPLFFNDDEWAFILAACDRLIPSQGNGPGALEAHVPVFIDRQLDGDYGHATDWYMEGPFVAGSPDLGFQYPYTPREVYQRGIALTQRWCQQTHGASFDALDAQTRDQVLSDLEKGNIDFAAMDEEWLPAADFFSGLLQNTHEGYFADPIYGGNRHMGPWKMVGFPGARGSFRDWVDQHDVEYPLGPVSLSGERG